MRKRMGHTAVSATQASSGPYRFGKMEPKRNAVIRIVDTKTNIIQTEPNV